MIAEARREAHRLIASYLEPIKPNSAPCAPDHPIKGVYDPKHIVMAVSSFASAPRRRHPD